MFQVLKESLQPRILYPVKYLSELKAKYITLNLKYPQQKPKSTHQNKNHTEWDAEQNSLTKGKLFLQQQQQKERERKITEIKKSKGTGI